MRLNVMRAQRHPTALSGGSSWPMLAVRSPAELGVRHGGGGWWPDWEAEITAAHRDRHFAHLPLVASTNRQPPPLAMAGEGAEKRKAEDGDAQEAAKRPRVDGSNGGAPAAAPAAKKLGIDLEKLQKAKAALQKQKELAERLKKAGIAVRGAWDRRRRLRVAARGCVNATERLLLVLC